MTMRKAGYFSLIVRVESEQAGAEDFAGDVVETLSGKRWIIRPAGSASAYVVFIERAEETTDPDDLSRIDSSVNGAR